MSDAKWRKFFGVTAQCDHAVFCGIWKLVDETEPVQGHLPRFEDIWETAVDGCLNGPVEYRRIEWIDIPLTVSFRRYAYAPAARLPQDLELLQRALNAVGRFPLEDTGTALRIRGYAP